tara:strand:- start:734 stop:898 length:165 start_codon:yes stop_codon:yes gene_type:complete
MSNLISPDKNIQEISKIEDNQSNGRGPSQKIYSNCVSTHDDVCFLEHAEYFHQD